MMMMMMMMCMICVSDIVTMNLVDTKRQMYRWHTLHSVSTKWDLDPPSYFEGGEF